MWEIVTWIAIWCGLTGWAIGTAVWLLFYFFLVYLEINVGELRGPGADYFHRINRSRWRWLWVVLSAFGWPASVPYATLVIRRIERMAY